jgi:hypothetical protein
VSLRARGLAAVAAAALAATLALPVMSSKASFNSTSANPGNTVSADSADNYVHLWSQGTDPAGLTGYAIKRNSSPAVPAATGSDGALKVALGGNKNVNGLVYNRVLTVQALNPLPAGTSPLTATVTTGADPATGLQPITSATLSKLDGSGAGSTATLTEGSEVQLNLTVRTNPPTFPGNNVLYAPTVTITFTYPGYSGNFLSYVVPVTIWDGLGTGP